MKQKTIISPEYAAFVGELKDRIRAARISAARAVNQDLILLYWDIGRGILERQEKLGWGQSVVEMLARDLQKAFPGTRGFSPDNLWRMRQFFAVYGRTEFLEQVVPEIGTLPKPVHETRTRLLEQAVPELSESLDASRPGAAESRLLQLLASVPWGHHIEILKKVAAPQARLYYLRASAQLGWSRNVLLNQIKAKAYERSLAEGKAHNFPAVLPEYLAEQAEEALKSSYNLEFLGIGREIRERDLENRLLARLRDFILELGYGFCFIGNQYRLVLGRKEYFIDLLFYHRFLKALVAVELKVGPFEPAHAGQMDFYLNLLNEKERAPADNPSIGIILCAERDKLEVEFALKTKTNPIGVAEYRLTDKLPKALKGKLPSERELRKALMGSAKDA